LKLKTDNIYKDWGVGITPCDQTDFAQCSCWNAHRFFQPLSNPTQNISTTYHI